METYITLLRGINVSGKNKLLMKELVQSLEKSGLRDVKTYIQSGNIVFKHPKASLIKLTHKITDVIEESHGYRLAVITLSCDALKTAMQQNPFPEAEDEPSKLHIYFLDTPPVAPDIGKLNDLKTSTEKFELRNGLFYLHTPDGMGRSKLAAQAEKALGVSATARNWRSATKILEMAIED